MHLYIVGCLVSFGAQCVRCATVAMFSDSAIPRGDSGESGATVGELVGATRNHSDGIAS